mgnify:CR=1 FL=1
MYYYLSGELTLCEGGICVVDCGGVGYKLTTSLTTSQNLSDKLGQKVRLFTHLAVREDGIELFGFESNEERSCFNLLIGVSGVGPKAAISILSMMSPDRFSLAVCTEDTKFISKAPGIGPKTAARIVLELKDKISKDIITASPASTIVSPTKSSPMSKNLSEACEALMVLGYDKNTILSVIRDIDSTTDVGLIIKKALKKLAR